MSDPFAPRPLGDFAAFPVGSRVTLTTQFQDFHFFRLGETGRVVRNEGRYLGVIVALDHPFVCDHGHYRHEIREFNFNPIDLAQLADHRS